MFGREYRMPLNMLYGTNQLATRNSFREYEKEMQELYELVRLNMETRQRVNATYYDKKVRDNVLEVGQKVLILDPRVKGNWLKPKYNRSGKVISEKHPAYEIEIDNDGKKHWFTRDRLRINLSLFQDQRVLEPKSVENQDEDDEDTSSDEEEEAALGREAGGRLRAQPRPPQRMGDIYTHAFHIIHCT